MSTPTTPSPKSAGEPNLVNADAPGLEERLHQLWKNYSQIVTVVLVVIAVGIAAKGGWEYFAGQREHSVEQAYAAASTKAQLQAFIAANPSHPLAAAAQLRLGDEAYAAGNFADAVAAYDAAAGSLKSGPLASRARLGSAMAKLQGGRESEGMAALKAIAGDANEFKAYRAEADYHLASQAFASHDAAGVKTYTGQLMQVDPTSPWVQRVMQFRAETVGGEKPAATAGSAATPASSASPEIKLPGTGK
ncbi:MAG TPA: tetratricopeptide repeat protein [Opitutus sp.]|nr:tetratricopeptide repeat protein [Opitutus sp.]